jgi:TPR repeat protein
MEDNTYENTIESKKGWKSLPIDWDNSPNRERFPKQAIVKEENGKIILTTDCSGAHLYQLESQNLRDVNPEDTLRFSYKIQGNAKGITLTLRDKTHKGPIPGAIFELQNGSNIKQDLQFVVPKGAKDISVLLYNDKKMENTTFTINELKIEKKPLPNIIQIFPARILGYVFTFLPVKDLLTLSYVSTEMNTFSKSNYCWNGRFINGIKRKSKDEFKEEFLHPTLFTIENKYIYDIKTYITILYKTEESRFRVSVKNEEFFCDEHLINFEAKSGEEIKIRSNILPFEKKYEDFLGIIVERNSTDEIECCMSGSKYPIVGSFSKKVYLLKKHPKAQREKLIIYPYGESNFRPICIDTTIYNALKDREKGKEFYMLGLNYKKIGDTEQAFTFFSQALKAGVKKAFYELGLMYEKGNGVQKNIPNAIKYYEEATKTDDKERADAFVSLGKLYWKGAEGLKQDFDKALQYFKSAGVHKEALYNMGCMYLEEEGIQKNSRIAIQLFERAFSLGSIEAHVKLGYIYFKGIGIPRDLEKAKHYLDIANTFKKNNIENQKLLQEIQTELN